LQEVSAEIGSGGSGGTTVTENCVATDDHGIAIKVLLGTVVPVPNVA